MKKSVIFLALIISCICTTKAIAIASENVDYPIDIQLTKCLEKDYSTAGMNKCTYEATEAWNKEIIRYVQLIKKELPKEQLPIFITSDKYWKKYFINEKKLIAKTIYVKEGTINTNIAAGIINGIVRQRAIYLKNYLSDLLE